MPPSTDSGRRRLGHHVKATGQCSHGAEESRQLRRRGESALGHGKHEAPAWKKRQLAVKTRAGMGKGRLGSIGGSPS